MYKNIILTIFIIIMAGCSKPKPDTKLKSKPDTKPSWYTQVPVDYKLFYAVASSDSVKQAKKIAIVNMRESLSTQVNNKNNLLIAMDKKTLVKIKEHNKEIANRLSFSRIKLEKTKTFQGKELVLISIPRIDLFNRIKIISDIKLHRAEEAYKKSLNKNAIERYMALELAIKELPALVSLAEYKEFLISTYSSADEFAFLNKIKKEYDDLKNSIHFYILTDGNSRIFSHSIKNAIKSEGLHVDNDINSKNNFKLLVTSKTENSQDYTFNKSKTLVKLTTFNSEKKKIKFRQHTFVGKSRKNAKEAKEQAAVQLDYKIKKLGIFDFI